jgi:hypothetical protein
MTNTSEQKTEKKTYHPFEHFITDSEGYYPWVVHEMRYDENAVRAVSKALSDMGFRRFSYLGAGGQSLVLETTEHQLVRIALAGLAGDNNIRPKHPAILQPITRKKLHIGLLSPKTLLIEVMPKVRSEGVTQDHCRMVYEALEKDGITTEDTYQRDNIERVIKDEQGRSLYRTCNVGLIDLDGKEVPVLIDPGMIKQKSLLPKIGGYKHVNFWVDENGRWLQEKYDMRREPTNVINSRKLMDIGNVMKGDDSFLRKLRLKKDTRHESQTIKAIAEDGLYPDEVAKLYERAIEHRQGDENFSDTLRREREAMRGNSAPSTAAPNFGYPDNEFERVAKSLVPGSIKVPSIRMVLLHVNKQLYDGKPLPEAFDAYLAEVSRLRVFPGEYEAAKKTSKYYWDGKFDDKIEAAITSARSEGAYNSPIERRDLKKGPLSIGDTYALRNSGGNPSQTR